MNPHIIHDSAIADLLGDPSPLDRPLNVTAFADLGARSRQTQTRSLRDIADRLAARAPAAAKADLPLFKLATFGEVPTVKGSLRHDANLQAVDGIEGDYDAGRVTAEEACERLRRAGLAFLIYTTPSHTAAAPRWRVLCPTSATLPPHARAALCDRLNGALGGILSVETWTLSQAFYFGRVSGVAFMSDMGDGRAIDLAADLDAGAIGKPTADRSADDSRSGRAFALAAIVKREGGTFDAFKTRLATIPDLAAWAAGKGGARQVERAWERSADGRDPADVDSLFDEAGVAEVSGDIEAGRAFAERYEGRFRHVYGDDRWLRFDGARWAPCSAGEHLEAGKSLAADALKGAADDAKVSDSAGAKARLSAALKLFKDSGRLKSMVAMARSDPRLVTPPDAFDRDPWLLGVPNGVVDLRTGALLPADASQMVSRQAGPAYAPDAAAPQFLAFLAKVQPDPHMRAFLQRAVGYTLTGLVDEERFFFAHGTGANGKSVFANVVAALLGDFAVSVGAKLLTKGSPEGDRERLIVRLMGARLALANETAAGDVWDDAHLKTITSRERVPGRFLYGEAFDFMPTHKLWIRGNHLPGAHDAGDAFWRRILPIAFPVSLPEPERVGDLDRRIIEGELSGVLTWAIEGCRMWRNGGLGVPAAVERERDAYRADTDIIGVWLTENAVRDPHGRTPAGAAYASFGDGAARTAIARRPPRRSDASCRRAGSARSRRCTARSTPASPSRRASMRTKTMNRAAIHGGYGGLEALSRKSLLGGSEGRKFKTGPNPPYPPCADDRRWAERVGPSRAAAAAGSRRPGAFTCAGDL